MTMPASGEVHMAMPYRFYFLWLEPIAILLGGLQAIFQPIEHLNVFTPLRVPAIPFAFKPVMYQLGALELFMAGVQALVMRQALAARQLDICKMVIALMLFGDAFHLFGMVEVMGLQLLQPHHWRPLDYSNVGMLLVALPLRIAFLAGFGVRSANKYAKAA